MKSAIAVVLLFISVSTAAQYPPVKEIRNSSVEKWPHMPVPFETFNWSERFLAFDDFIFDWNKRSEFPTIRWDSTHFNYSSRTIAMPAYYGDKRFFTDGWTDGILSIAQIAGAALCGRRKDSVPVDGTIINYVVMLKTFKHDLRKRQIAYNYADPKMVRIHTDFWYDIIPSLLYYMVGDLYPREKDISNSLRDVAEGMYSMVVSLGGDSVDFYYQGYDFDTGKPVDSAVFNGKSYKWKNPETGVAAGAILYWAYQQYHDEKYLTAAKWCMNYYERLTTNPFYEVSISFAPYLAARMNAEVGTKYDVPRYFDWLIKGSSVRQGFGTEEKQWNGYDVYGLIGSRSDGGGEGYVFGLETFANAFFAPALRYDPRHARTTAIWLLNAANAARFFYADQMPADKQFYGEKYRKAPEKVIPYEGLRMKEKEQSPRATGDPVAYNKFWAAMGPAFDPGTECTNLALYDGAWAGFFGAVLTNTNVPRILRIDVKKLDFYTQDTAIPQYVYYNPYKVSKKVLVKLDAASDLFDIQKGRYLAKNKNGSTEIPVKADEVVQLLVVPAGSGIQYEKGRITVNGKTAAYYF